MCCLAHHFLAVEDENAMLGCTVETTAIERVDDVGTSCGGKGGANGGNEFFFAKGYGGRSHGSFDNSLEIELFAIKFTGNLHLGFGHETRTAPTHALVVAIDDAALHIAVEAEDVAVGGGGDVGQNDIADGNFEEHAVVEVVDGEVDLTIGQAFYRGCIGVFRRAFAPSTNGVERIGVLLGALCKGKGGGDGYKSEE